jgi:hypothetical protein
MKRMERKDKFYNIQELKTYLTTHSASLLIVCLHNSINSSLSGASNSLKTLQRSLTMICCFLSVRKDESIDNLPHGFFYSILHSVETGNQYLYVFSYRQVSLHLSHSHVVRVSSISIARKFINTLRSCTSIAVFLTFPSDLFQLDI